MPGTEQTLVVAGLTSRRCAGSTCCRWRQGFGRPVQDGAKTPGAKGQGPSEHTCLVLPRHEQSSLSCQSQQHSAVETISTIAAQTWGSPLGQASPFATPVRPKQQQPVGQQTSSRQALQPTNTHACSANNSGSTPSPGCSEDGRFPRERSRRSAVAALPPHRTWRSYFLCRPQAHAGAELQACGRLAHWERPLRDKQCCYPASHRTGKGSWGWADPPHPPLLHLEGLGRLTAASSHQSLKRS